MPAGAIILNPVISRSCSFSKALMASNASGGKFPLNRFESRTQAVIYKAFECPSRERSTTLIVSKFKFS